MQVSLLEMNPGELIARLDFARVAALEAGAIAMRHFQDRDLNVERKADASPVTVADRNAEKHLRQEIARRYPRDGIVGEEFGIAEGSSGYRWILDPIDGTNSFIHGVPLFGTLIGMEFEGQTALGIIHFPALNEMVFAAAGHGAWHARSGGDVARCYVATRKTLAESLCCTSGIQYFIKRGAVGIIDELTRRCRLSRTWGDCYGYMLIATGRADIMIDPVMNLWDCAALKPVIEEAGGAFTDWRGVPRIDGGEALATNQELLPQVLELIRATPTT